MVDRQFPHQVMLKNDAKLRKHLWEISHLATSLGASPLGHHFYFVEEAAHYSVYCFSSRDNAEAFLTAWNVRCGLSQAAIASRKRVKVKAAIDLLEHVGRVVGDDWLGLTLAADFDLRELGMLYYVAASSERFGEAPDAWIGTSALPMKRWTCG